MKNRLLSGIICCFFVFSGDLYAQSVGSPYEAVKDGKGLHAAPIEFASHIMRTGRAKVAFDGVKVVENEDRDLILHAGYTNTGKIMIEPEIWVEIYDTAGNLLDRMQGDPRRVYPGMTSKQSISVTHILPGTYEVLLVVDAGEDNIFGAQYTLDLTPKGIASRQGLVNGLQP